MPSQNKQAIQALIWNSNRPTSFQLGDHLPLLEQFYHGQEDFIKVYTDETDTHCSICLEEYHEYPECGLVSLACGHIFHLYCTARSLRESFNCPYCQSEVSASQVTQTPYLRLPFHVELLEPWRVVRKPFEGNASGRPTYPVPVLAGMMVWAEAMMREPGHQIFDHFAGRLGLAIFFPANNAVDFWAIVRDRVAFRLWTDCTAEAFRVRTVFGVELAKLIVTLGRNATKKYYLIEAAAGRLTEERNVVGGALYVSAQSWANDDAARTLTAMGRVLLGRDGMPVTLPQLEIGPRGPDDTSL